MTAIQTLAAEIVALKLSDLTSAQVDRLELHVLDTLAALAYGAGTDAGLAIERLIGSSRGGDCPVPGYGSPAMFERAVTVASAATRCSEVDDIHLSSCTTPGACVVPTAVALAAAGMLQAPQTFLEAVAAGYAVMIRVGLAIDGPRILLNGVWPSLFAAPMAAAAVGAKARGLSSDGVAGALATALLASSGNGARPASPTTSRWLLFGDAARRGLLASEWAGRDLRGDEDALERRDGMVSGVAVEPATLAKPLQVGQEIDRVAFKPYPCARQALAAVEACRTLGEAHAIDPAAVDEIVVQLPDAQRAIVDRPGPPAGRFESLVSVHYQAAVALCAPRQLHAGAGPAPLMTPAIARLMTRVRVAGAPDLEHRYPAAWPARVTIRLAGRVLEQEILHPDGDPESGFGWADVERKLGAAVERSLQPNGVRRIVAALRNLHTSERLPPLWDLSELAADT